MIYFSPNGGCTDAIVQAIGSAKQSIFVMAYTFTSERIFEALSAKGKIVKFIGDVNGSQGPGSLVGKLTCPVLIDHKHKIMHDKVMIIDSTVVLTGSFNFTLSAETVNAENLLILTDATLAERYIANWNFHAAHSVPFVKSEIGAEVELELMQV